MRKFITHIGLLALTIFATIFLGLSAVNAQSTDANATVYTDKADYLPGETVIIEGDGWEAGEQVKLEIDHSTVSHSNTVLYATADANGHIYNNEFLIKEIHLDEFFTLLATGQSSGLTAQTTFTDGSASSGQGTMTVSRTTACTGSTGNSFTFYFRNPNSDDNFLVGSQASIFIPAGWSAPNTSDGSPGFISVTPVGSGSATFPSSGAITGSSLAGWTITVNFNSQQGLSYGFNLSYNGVTAPTTGGTYAFTTKTKASGSSSFSNISNQPNVIVSAATSTPTANAASSRNCTSFQANWSSSGGATAYLLDVSTANDFSTFVSGYNGLNVGTNTSRTVSGLTAGTTYYYRVRASNSCGLSGNSSTITAATSPAAPATPGAITGTTTVCRSTSGLVYSVAAVTDATSYNWTLPSGWSITSSSSSTPSITVSASSTAVSGTISVTATNSCGTSSASSLTATANPLPQGSFNGSNICPGGTGTLTFTATAGTGPFTVVYRAGTTDYTATNVASGTAFNVQVNPSASTSYTLVSVTGNNGCPRTSSFNDNSATITVNPLPSTPFANSGSDASCTQLQANWSDANNANAYWLDVSTASDFSSFVTGYNNLNVFDNTSRTISGLTAGTTYYYRVRASNSCGTSSNSSTITYATSPAAPATPGAITGTTTVCSSTSGLVYTVAAVSNATSYNWTLPNNWSISSGSGTRSITVFASSTAASGTISVTANNSCGTSSASTLAVIANPRPTATVSGGGFITAGGSAPIQAALTGTSPWNVTWSDGVTQNGVTASPATRNVSPSSSTTYTVTALTDATACTNTGTGTATVSITTALTPATGGLSICSGTVGGAYTSLTGPVYQEPTTADITAGTIILNAPAGFIFNTGSGVTVRVNGGTDPLRNINNLSSGSTIPASVTSTTISIAILEASQSGNGSAPNKLTWQGIQVRPTATSPLATGNITKTGTSSMVGITDNVTSFGQLDEDAGSAATLSGVQSVCEGSTTNFSSNVSGGTWGSNNPSVATVNTSTGVVTGVSYGTATITYTVTGASCNGTTTRTVTVNALPSAGALSGAQTICHGSNTTFSSTVSGGTWSSSTPSVATVNASTGAITGVSDGTATITYSVTSSGCTGTATRSVTVNAIPSAGTLSGTQTICEGATTTFSSSVSGGTWSSSNAAVAAVDASTGVITGVVNGSAIITYSVTSSGCTGTDTRTVTVNDLPTVAAISGSSAVCEGSTINLDNATGGGVWSSSDITKATVSSTGEVTGVANGTATIRYTVTNSNGCQTQVSKAITVNDLPTVAAISGSSAVCEGSTINLDNTTSGGVWSSSDITKATVSSTGEVTGVANGTATIRYTVTNSNGCQTQVSKAITVNDLPTVAAISGSSAVCEGSTINLDNATSGGVWSSSDITKATVSSTGEVTGVANGTATIRYTVTNSNGCQTQVSKAITVNDLPTVAAISGSSAVCEGSTINLDNTTSGGVWSSSDITKATVSSTGEVTGVANGTATIRYTVTNSNGCQTQVSKAITVNDLPTVAAISGSSAVCEGSTINLDNATGGGVWSSSDITKATVSSTGEVTGVANGTVTIRYMVTNSNGCQTQVSKAITVNDLPTVAAISGSSAVCEGSTINLDNATSGGVWSSSDITKATVSSTGEVTGVANGTATIRYTVTNSNGCQTQVSKAITVNDLPTVAAISGSSAVCEGSTINLDNATSGGVWSSSDITKATVSSTGEVTGVANGTATIRYTVTNSNGCQTQVSKAITVNDLPTVAAISGSSAVCEGSTINLDNTTSGGVWSSSNTAVATVNGSTGVVNGIVDGAVTIYYTVTNAHGCVTQVSKSVTVNALPTVAAISGNSAVCVGSTITLTNTTTGGVWSSSNTALATVNSSGVVSGVNNGAATIYYTVTNTNSCVTQVSKSVTVNALPTVAAISGNSAVCVGSTMTLANTTTGGVWSSSNTAVATVNSSQEW
jgi:uncharacterized protein YjdB